MSDDALAHFRAHREGTLIADERPIRLRYVTDPATGRLVFPADGATLAAESLVLFVPDEQPQIGNELQLMLEIEELDPGHAACDRWRAYHGDPRLARWGLCAIEGAKFAGRVVEHEPMAAPNPLAAAEPRLCRVLNTDRGRLCAACRRVAGVEIKEPIAVGVDPWGVDVRARFGIVRLTFIEGAGTPEAAERAVEALLSGGGA